MKRSRRLPRGQETSEPVAHSPRRVPHPDRVGTAAINPTNAPSSTMTMGWQVIVQPLPVYLERRETAKPIAAPADMPTTPLSTTRTLLFICLCRMRDQARGFIRQAGCGTSLAGTSNLFPEVNSAFACVGPFDQGAERAYPLPIAEKGSANPSSGTCSDIQAVNVLLFGPGKAS